MPHTDSSPDRSAAGRRYAAERIAHWNGVAAALERGREHGGAYHRRLKTIYRQLVLPGRNVLELGSASGDLLAALEPANGTGVDFSPAMVERARRRHPGLRFVEADVHALEEDGGAYDAILLSDLVNDLWDVQAVLERVASRMAPGGRLIVNVFSQLWRAPLAAAGGLRLAHAPLAQNWLTPQDVENLFELAGLRLVRRWQEVLLPLPIPGIDAFANRFLVRFWPFRHLALSNFFVARRLAAPAGPEPRVSVVVPARNEAGNVPEIFDRVPEMGGGTELILVEGHSRDDTYAAIEREIAARPGTSAKLLRQRGEGKGDAVREGFAVATGDILMILDADLTVPPEDLPRFYDAIRSGKGEFVNGVRLVYPMESEAMQLANLVANKSFGIAFSWLLGQPIRDTLCGTKVLKREDYERVAANRDYFGRLDPFGDFDLLFGAARLELEILEVPIRYRERSYGSTNIRRWRHGWLLLKMCLLAARRLKFR